MLINVKNQYVAPTVDVDRLRQKRLTWRPEAGDQYVNMRGETHILSNGRCIICGVAHGAFTITWQALDVTPDSCDKESLI